FEQARFMRASRDIGIERRDALEDADIVDRRVLGFADRRIMHRISRFLADEPRRAVIHQLDDGLPARTAPTLVLAGIEIAVKIIGMRRIEVAFDALEIIAVLIHLDDEEMRRLELEPGEAREGRHLVRRAHVGPDDAARLAHRISLVANGLSQFAVRRLGGRFQNRAALAQLPAVIETPQPADLVARVKERSPPMRTEFAQQADGALRIAKTDQRLAEQLDADRRAAA